MLLILDFDIFCVCSMGSGRGVCDLVEVQSTTAINYNLRLTCSSYYTDGLDPDPSNFKQVAYK